MTVIGNGYTPAEIRAFSCSRGRWNSGQGTGGDHLLRMGGRMDFLDFRPAHSVSHAMMANDCRVFPSPTSSAIRIPGVISLDFTDNIRLRTAWTPASWCQRSSMGVNILSACKSSLLNAAESSHGVTPPLCLWVLKRTGIFFVNPRR